MGAFVDDFAEIAFLVVHLFVAIQHLGSQRPVNQHRVAPVPEIGVFLGHVEEVFEAPSDLPRGPPILSRAEEGMVHLALGNPCIHQSPRARGSCTSEKESGSFLQARSMAATCLQRPPPPTGQEQRAPAIPPLPRAASTR